MSGMAARLEEVKARIRAAAARAGRDPADVRLVAVSKKMPVSAVEEAIASGHRLFGENYVQEAREKLSHLGPVRSCTEWHLIGHLQKNKVKYAVRLFDCIQTVDSLELGVAIDRRCAKEGLVAKVLVQVNIGKEATKSGAMPEEAPRLVRELSRLEHLDVQGLMTIHPVGSAEDTRKWFRRMRTLFEEIRSGIGSEGFRHLSMGMSRDFEMAVEEGATIVRVGTAIFGPRTE